jgi:hypothetical protein
MQRSPHPGRRGYEDPTEASFNHLLRNYKQAARKRKHVFALTRKQFRRLTKLPCHYCSVAARQQHNRNDHPNRQPYLFNGLDRIDNSVGYTITNVIPCCTICNMLRGSLTYHEFIKRISLIAQNLISKTPLPKFRKAKPDAKG